MNDAIATQWRGHAATIAGFGRNRLHAAAETKSWVSIRVESFDGPVELAAVYDDVLGSDELMISVHGLGGSARSQYQVQPARSATTAGMSVLRVSQRGADRSGTDLHHAGLWQDLVAVIEQWVPERYRSVYLVGFSMGGHVALHVACHPPARLRGVVAVCTPLHLDNAVHHVDHDALPLYRRYLLGGLRTVYRRYVERNGLDVDDQVIRGLRTIRAWDGQAIVGRFGYESAEEYYATESIGPRLHDLGVPARLVYADNDPVVSLGAIAPGAASPSDVIDDLVGRGVETTWLSGGGHVALPRVRGGQSGIDGQLHEQLAPWFRSRR